MPQPWEAKACCLHSIHSPVTILDVGGVDDNAGQKAGGVGGDVALATFDLLTRVISANSAAFGGFYNLIVNHARVWVGLAPPQSRTLPAPGNTSPSHGFLHLFAKTAES